MSVTNFSMIWAQLASPLQASGMVPFVDTDNASITGDVLNFFYDKNLDELHLSNNTVIKSQQNQIGIASPVTVNYYSGVVTVKAGTASTNVICNKVRPGALVFLQSRAIDTTATRLSVTVGGGQFTIVANAAATADFNVNFIVQNVDIQTV